MCAEPACYEAARHSACASYELEVCQELAVAAGCNLDRPFADDYRYVAKVFCGGG